MWVFKDHSLFRCSFSYLDFIFLFFLHFLGLVCLLDAWLYIYVNAWMLLKYLFVVYCSFLRFILFYFLKLIEFLSMILVLFWCIFFFILFKSWGTSFLCVCLRFFLRCFDCFVKKRSSAMHVWHFVKTIFFWKSSLESIFMVTKGQNHGMCL